MYETQQNQFLYRKRMTIFIETRDYHYSFTNNLKCLIIVLSFEAFLVVFTSF